jgi:hypothetical protein
MARATGRSTARPPDRVAGQCPSPQLKSHVTGQLATDSYARIGGSVFLPGRPAVRNAYVTRAAIEQLAQQLSERDIAILGDLDRVRVLTGGQLTRLHFAELSPGSRERTRRRVLARLVELQLANTLERVIGGVHAGSSGTVYCLGIAGQRLLPLLDASSYTEGRIGRVRSPATPGSLFLTHSLAIAEVYVQVCERERASELALSCFVIESAAWHPDGHGGVIKPDAYVRVQAQEIEDCWWLEVDRATESIPTLKRKLLSYVEFARAGQPGPDGITPRVLVTVPHDHRLTAVRTMIDDLPAPAAELIFPTLHDQAVGLMVSQLWG